MPVKCVCPDELVITIFSCYTCPGQVPALSGRQQGLASFDFEGVDLKLGALCYKPDPQLHLVLLE